MNYLSVCSGIEAATVAWHPLGWQPVAFSEIEKFPSQVLAHHYDVPNWGDMNGFKEWPDADIDVLVEEHPVSRSQSPDSERGWLRLTETSHSSIVRSLNDTAPTGWYGKTSPASCRQTKDGTLVPLSERWLNSGMASPGECLTLSTSEWNHTLAPSLNDDGVCSLSEVLEAGEVPPKYYLSQKACSGILRRAEKRGKELPPLLALALQQVAGLEPTPS